MTAPKEPLFPPGYAAPAVIYTLAWVYLLGFTTILRGL